ncbi:putative phage abortive infection protein [Lactococcus petauri]|uniref:putative phage abortive infection protein n=1 Tax=Lactococcus petauri TaxID=1940789 RepID=UPI001FB014E0|nr:putative phage abortive infection protein [Lactococcus petauri]
MNIIFLNSNFTSADWLNFLGNIVGSIVGVVGAFCVMFLQLKKEREKNRKEKIDNTFFNLLTLLQNVKNEFDTENFIKNIREEIIILKVFKRGDHYTEAFDNKREKFINDIDGFNKSTKGYYNAYCSEIKVELNKRLSESRYHYQITRLVGAVEKTHIEDLIKYTREMDDFYREFDDKKLGFKYKITETDIPDILKKVSLMTDNNSGNYFRTLYRCLKYIMVAELTMDEKKFYSGVLRGILSSDEMLIVFYNCIYYEKGEKFKELLEKSQNGKRLDFFGDKNDLENLNKGYDLPFFSKKKFLFPEYDMRHLEELINGTPTKAN